jgi:hypothetical protein
MPTITNKSTSYILWNKKENLFMAANNIITTSFGFAYMYNTGAQARRHLEEYKYLNGSTYNGFEVTPVYKTTTMAFGDEGTE